MAKALGKESLELAGCRICMGHDRRDIERLLAELSDPLRQVSLMRIFDARLKTERKVVFLRSPEEVVAYALFHWNDETDCDKRR